MYVIPSQQYSRTILIYRSDVAYSYALLFITALFLFLSQILSNAGNNSLHIPHFLGPSRVILFR